MSKAQQMPSTLEGGSVVWESCSEGHGGDGLALCQGFCK